MSEEEQLKKFTRKVAEQLYQDCYDSKVPESKPGGGRGDHSVVALRARSCSKGQIAS